MGGFSYNFWATVCKTVRPMLSVRCLSVLSVLSVTFVHCGQTVRRIKMKLGMPVGLGPGHIVLDGTQLPSPKGHSPPTFGPYLLRPNVCMDHDVTWYGARPRPRRLCFRWRPRSPQFSAHVYCGQTAGWMKLVLGVEVRLSPGHFVLDGDPAPSSKRGRRPPPQFSAHFYCGQTAGCIKMPLGTDVGLGPGDFELDGDPVPLPKGASSCHLVRR